jgi:ATP-dependent Zn protease
VLAVNFSQRATWIAVLAIFAIGFVFTFLIVRPFFGEQNIIGALAVSAIIWVVIGFVTLRGFRQTRSPEITAQIAKKPSLLQRVWKIYLVILPILVLLLVIWVPIQVFIWNHYFADQSLAMSLVMAGLALLFMLGIFFANAFLYRKAGDALGFFLKHSAKKSTEERRKELEKHRDAMQDEALSRQALSSRIHFYRTLGIALVWFFLFFSFIYFFALPSDWQKSLAAIIPTLVPLVMAATAMAVYLLPRILVYIGIVVLTAFSSLMLMVAVGIVGAMGPQAVIMIVFQLFHFIMMAFQLPLFFIFNILIMLGPLAAVNIMQIKKHMPGESGLNETLDDVRGQDEAKKPVITQLRLFVSDEGKKLVELCARREPGMLFVGPPGTGKTLLAKAIANVLNVPLIFTAGPAFRATFLGIDVLVMLYFLWLARNASKEVDGRGCVLVIDEAEDLLRARPGALQGGQGHRSRSIWSLFQYDQWGAISSCGMTFDTDACREIFWKLKFPEPEHPVVGWVHRFMFPGAFGGGMMGSGAQLLLLAAMDGMGSAPFLARLWRSKLNFLLDILFVPPVVRVAEKRRVLRIPAAKPVDPNWLFIAITNMPHLVDSAIKRSGRFGLTIQFVTPGEAERYDIADLYFERLAKKGSLHPELQTKDKRTEFARASIGLSPVEIQQVIEFAVTFRNDHIERLKELQEMIEVGKELSERDKRFWDRYRSEIGMPNWDKPWATWESLTESLGAIRWGTAKPTRTSAKHREVVAFHEVAGHLIPLKGFMAEFMKPTGISVLPRGSALGLVAHAPIAEHDPEPQRFWEGMIRVSLGSVIAERMFFKDSQPGVAADMSNATKMAAIMVGELAMVPRRVKDRAERERYIEYGKTVFVPPSGGEMGMPNPIAAIAASKQDEILLMLGQGFVDSYRLQRKNLNKVESIVQELLRTDEILGKRLEEIWETLEIEPLTNADKDVWPDEIVEPESPFYH